MITGMAVATTTLYNRLLRFCGCRSPGGTRGHTRRFSASAAGAGGEAPELDHRVAGDDVALALRLVVKTAHPRSTECLAGLDASDRATERAPPKVHARRATESGGSRWAGGRAPARAARDQHARARAGVGLPRTRWGDELELGAKLRRVLCAGSALADLGQAFGRST